MAAPGMPNLSSTKSEASDRTIEENRPEGLGREGASWGGYPLDDLLIRSQARTVLEVIRGIEDSRCIMDPDFQRDCVWPEDKQSRLVESVVLRIPLPAFYLAEDDQGRMVVVDGLQRLSTLGRFMGNELRLKLPERRELHGKSFAELSPKLQNRFEACTLVLHVIDSKVPERVRLDIFERVNGSVPPTRQQMRNCLFTGRATRFLKAEARTELFLKATGRCLDRKGMGDREFVNRFCSFQILGADGYHGDMDDFLARGLRRMNGMDESQLSKLSGELRRGLANNLLLFGENAFRRSRSDRQRAALNASFWDVMSTSLSRLGERCVADAAGELRKAVCSLLEDKDFVASITCGTSGAAKAARRFAMVREALREALGDRAR